MSRETATLCVQQMHITKTRLQEEMKLPACEGTSKRKTITGYKQTQSRDAQYDGSELPRCSFILLPRYNGLIIQGQRHHPSSGVVYGPEAALDSMY